MNIHLQPLTGSEDKSNPLYSTTNCQQVLSMYEDYYPKVGYHPPWVGYLIIRNSTVAGSCGFVSPPIDGRVEIAYWTFSEYEGQGVATFGCEALINIAKKENPALTITAKTEPRHNASTAILMKNGFVQTRVVQDHEIGDAWEWVHIGEQMGE
jgi:[ribosomal protein S5]-alanine N-acetyltransferase